MLLTKKTRVVLDKMIMELWYTPPQKFLIDWKQHISILYVWDNSWTNHIFFIWYNTFSHNYEGIYITTLVNLIEDNNFINSLILLITTIADDNKIKEISRNIFNVEYTLKNIYDLRLSMKKFLDKNKKNETELLRMFDFIEDSI